MSGVFIRSCRRLLEFHASEPQFFLSVLRFAQFIDFQLMSQVAVASSQAGTTHPVTLLFGELKNEICQKGRVEEFLSLNITILSSHKNGLHQQA